MDVHINPLSKITKQQLELELNVPLRYFKNLVPDDRGVLAAPRDVYPRHLHRPYAGPNLRSGQQATLQERPH